MDTAELSTDDALLAAVRDEVLAYGVRRATATSIAHRAGVSRVTVYRRGGGIRQLLDALVAEFRNAVEEVTALVPRSSRRGTDGRPSPPSRWRWSGSSAKHLWSQPC